MQKNGESYEKGMIAMDNNGYALEIRDVSKRFGGIVATIMQISKLNRDRFLVLLVQTEPGKRPYLI